MTEDKHSGKILDERYELVRLLDEGGMGAVYLGRHIRIGRRTAVKFLHAALVGQEDVVKRFYREAQAASAISHPNIIDIYDVGVAEWGEPYLVMEYLSGENLDSFLRRKGRVGLAVASAVVEPALRALSAAHEHGIVHRDIKPENIFIVQRQDAPPIIKIIDFGISKFVQDDTLKLTRTGTLLGTPSYMSPEQARGKGEVDHRADIYSLGVILYQLLTGELPFVGESYNDLIFTILTESHRNPKEVCPDFPDEALPIVEKLLEKEPNARYQSCSEVLVALESLPGYEERLSALEAMTDDMPEACFATGDLGPDFRTDDAVAATVLASIGSNRDAVTVDVSQRDPNAVTVDIPPAEKEDEEWVMESGHLPPPKRSPQKKRMIWPYVAVVGVLALSSVLFYASGLFDGDEAAHREINRAPLSHQVADKGRESSSKTINGKSVPKKAAVLSSDSFPIETTGQTDDDERERPSDNDTDRDSDTLPAASIENEKTPPEKVSGTGAGHKAPKAEAAPAPVPTKKKPQGEAKKKIKKTVPSPKTEPTLPPKTEEASPPQPEPAPVVSTSDRALSSKEVNRLAATKDRRIRRCYDLATIGRPDLAGILAVQVGMSGDVVDAKVIRNDLTPALANCVTRALESIEPPPNNGELVEIEKIYEFRQSKK